MGTTLSSGRPSDTRTGPQEDVLSELGSGWSSVALADSQAPLMGHSCLVRALETQRRPKIRGLKGGWEKPSRK